VVLSCFAGRAIRNGKPRSLLRSGFSLSASSASNLPDSLRYAPAMMLRGLSPVPAPIQITALSDARRQLFVRDAVDPGTGVLSKTPECLF
jgi:hypothetical protein